jgi:hypothetical protein
MILRGVFCCCLASMGNGLNDILGCAQAQYGSICMFCTVRRCGRRENWRLSKCV